MKIPPTTKRRPSPPTHPHSKFKEKPLQKSKEIPLDNYQKPSRKEFRVKGKEDGYFYQSSSNSDKLINVLGEIEHQLNMKPDEKVNRYKYSGKRQKRKGGKKKQHVIDEDNSLNESSIMTQGWGVTRVRTNLNASSVVYSAQENSYFSNMASKHNNRLRRQGK